MQTSLKVKSVLLAHIKPRFVVCGVEAGFKQLPSSFITFLRIK